MEAKHVRADLALGLGSGGARRFTTDLTAEYVRINADYTT
jgi:N-acetylglutamate synthase/N-acetylornithine aminotransferase